jgi:predicted nucleic acid-binding protein
VKAILDTSVLIDRRPLPTEIEAGISTLSLAELYFGVLATTDPDERSHRAAQLGYIEASFDALPLDERVARTLGQLQAAVKSRGANPRKRTADLAIAATAMVHDAMLLTRNARDFKLVGDLVVVRDPAAEAG